MTWVTCGGRKAMDARVALVSEVESPPAATSRRPKAELEEKLKSVELRAKILPLQAEKEVRKPSRCARMTPA